MFLQHLYFLVQWLHSYRSSRTKWSGQSRWDIRVSCLPGWHRQVTHQLIVLRNLKWHKITNNVPTATVKQLIYIQIVISLIDPHLRVTGWGKLSTRYFTGYILPLGLSSTDLLSLHPILTSQKTLSSGFYKTGWKLLHQVFPFGIFFHILPHERLWVAVRGRHELFLKVLDLSGLHTCKTWKMCYECGGSFLSARRPAFTSYRHLDTKS